MHIKQLGKELKERTESMNLKKSKNKSPYKSPITKKNTRSSIIMENNLKEVFLRESF